MRNIKNFLSQPTKFYSYLPALGIWEREVRRFLVVPAQTVFTPLGTAFLYFVLFGILIGGVMEKTGAYSFSHGVPYVVFLIPGLMTMENVSASFQNPVSSILIGKWTGSLIDVLMSPVSDLGLLCAYIGGAMVRATIVSVVVLFVGMICSHTIVPLNIFLLFLAISLTAIIFSSLSVIVGTYAKNFDQVGIVSSFVIQPLSFFSGIFFSFQAFPPWVQSLKFFNPIFYVVSMFRSAVLGKADVSPWLSFSMSTLFGVLAFSIAYRFIKKGFGLRN